MEYLSLYDFLGKPGRELGKEVYEYAKKVGIKVETKEISNPKYTGEVMMYPKDFLENYFSSMPIDKPSFDKDDLPF